MAQVSPAILTIEQCKEGFLDFYCKTPQARGLLSRYWNGYGFATKEAQHDWGIWSAACGFAQRDTAQKDQS